MHPTNNQFLKRTETLIKFKHKKPKQRKGTKKKAGSSNRHSIEFKI